MCTDVTSIGVAVHGVQVPAGAFVAFVERRSGVTPLIGRRVGAMTAIVLRDTRDRDRVLLLGNAPLEPSEQHMVSNSVRARVCLSVCLSVCLPVCLSAQLTQLYSGAASRSGRFCATDPAAAASPV